MKTNETHLKKTLGTKEVFAISAGAMISSGIFVLPAVVFAKAGPSVILGYLLASLCIIPAMLAKAELSTAMPKSGGTYFVIIRSFGPLFGTFSGLSNWFSISLKSAFALVGIGVFLEPLFPGSPVFIIRIIAVGFTIVFTVLNLLSVKESGRLQYLLILVLLAVLVFFSFSGIPKIDLVRFQPFAPGGIHAFFLITGMIFVSYGGLTKIGSIAEEIKDPSKSIPAGMFSAWAIVSVLYLFAVGITIGVLPSSVLCTALTPLSTAASVWLGRPGFILLAVAAMLAFITTANAGLMAASRAPLAMARDSLLPRRLGEVHKKLRTPVLSILITAFFMILCIIFLDIENLVKTASTMMLIMFAMENISVILMRQSRIISYRPTYRAPFYPVLQICGVLVYAFLIAQMGTLPLVLSGAFFAVSALWFFIYVRKRASRKSAFIHMMEDLTSKDIAGDKSELAGELLGILRERDQITEDRFDSIIAEAEILDMKQTCTRQEFFRKIAILIAERWHIDSGHIEAKLAEREAQASTLIYPGVAVPHAVPHIVIEGRHSFDIIPVRNKFGIIWNDENEVVYTAFCLIGSKDERNFHLKALMSIAQILQDPDFHNLWSRARNAEELRSVILVTKRRRT
ncbi:MAG: amino acid permease [Spirochaetales bacterium]|nr:amino acid permease [Spirochaetales bacterium]